MPFHSKVIGIEQVDDNVTFHEKRDYRPYISYLVWAILMVATLLVVASCGDSNGLYQGPNDDVPSWRR